MKKVISAFLLALAFVAQGFVAANAQGVYHQGYYNHNGSYVQPHWQSAPDQSYNNNWSVCCNVNPHTGQMGTLSPTWNDRYPNRY